MKFRKKIQYKCQGCKKTFITTAINRKYCNKKCYTKFKGFKKGHIPEHILGKHPIDWIGHNANEKRKEQIKNNNAKYWLGKHCHNMKSGKEHPNWKGGITPFRTKIWKSERYINWRKSVFERDNYECCCCLKKGKLNAHHILPFSEYPTQRFNVSNGLTVCKECHLGCHKTSYFKLF